jgi:lysozyme
MKIMKISQVGINLIKSFEGCILHSYNDPVGILTIGYGHTGKDVIEGRKITQQQAEEILKRDLAKFEEGVSELVKVPLNQYQFDALVSFSYNVGLGALGSSTLLKKLNKKDYRGAAIEFEKWVYAKGNKLKGLAVRRLAEKSLFNHYDETPKSNSQIGVVKVDVDVLNVRSNPDATGKIIGKIHKNKVLKCYGSQNGWYNVGSGWVSGKYVTFKKL